jgi:hypothetical protein
MKWQEFRSPYPALQTVLPKLSSVLFNQPWKPTFSTQDEARGFLSSVEDTTGHTLRLDPIWSLNHSNLMQSSIVGWTVVDLGD